MTPRARQDSTTTDPAERARVLALGMLDRAPRSAADLKARLVAKEVEPHVADQIIARYIEVGLLDDAALAAAVARTRFAERGQAPRVIAAELRRKGFGDEDIENALAPLDLESQQETARALAAARWARTQGLTEEARVRRVVSYVARKGYAAPMAYALVRDLQRADREAAGT